MQVRFKNNDLARVETEQNYTAGMSIALVRAFRKAMQRIRAAVDERDLRTPATHFEKLAGKRQHQYSLRLNAQFRLILELDKEASGTRVVVIAGIEDYH